MQKADDQLNMSGFNKEIAPEDDFEISYEVQEILTGTNSEFVPGVTQATSARELGFTNGDFGSTSPEQRGKNPRDRP